MKKGKKNIDNANTNDEKLSNKIIDLCLWYQIEDSHRWLDIIDLQIKNCQIQLDFLKEIKPFWFQKKKLEEHNKQIIELENQIYKYYEDLGKEVEIIQKMQEQLNVKR